MVSQSRRITGAAGSRPQLHAASQRASHPAVRTPAPLLPGRAGWRRAEGMRFADEAEQRPAQSTMSKQLPPAAVSVPSEGFCFFFFLGAATGTFLKAKPDELR